VRDLIRPDRVPWATAAFAAAPAQENRMSSSAPVAALVFFGSLIVALGLFVAGNIALTIVGLVTIFGAGLLQVLGVRRA
jgi:hypothetical protein